MQSAPQLDADTIARCVERRIGQGWIWAASAAPHIHVLFPPVGDRRRDWATDFIVHRPGRLVPHYAFYEED